MPHELSRRNQKNAQRYIENSTKDVLANLTTATKAASKSANPDATLSSLDSMISKMQGLKRKLENLHEEEMRLHRSNRARLQHLQDLYEVQSLVDVKYDEWSRTRLSRLLVDYLLREGYSESAAHLAASQGIEELVDVDAFVACHKIEKSLREGRNTQLALNWCKENSKELKKQGSMLEFELRLQQYIELVRQGHQAGMGDQDTDMDGMNGVSLDGGSTLVNPGEEKLVEARAHAKKYLSASGDFALLGKAAGLLAYRPWDEVKPYSVRLNLFTRQEEGYKELTQHYRIYTALPAGAASPASFSQPTTHSTPSLLDPFSTSPSPPDSPHSRPQHVMPQTPSRRPCHSPLPPTASPQHPSVRSAVRS